MPIAEWEGECGFAGSNERAPTTHPDPDLRLRLDHPLFCKVAVAQRLKKHGRETMKIVL